MRSATISVEFNPGLQLSSRIVTDTVLVSKESSPIRILLLALVCGIYLSLLAACSPEQPQTEPPDPVTRLLQADIDPGFKRAMVPIEFDFPRDHGAHPDYRSEWWYFTGNLETSGGKAFGYQFTLFRNALSASQPNQASRWATNQLYLAHFALTDIEQGRFYRDERFARGALGLAGVEHSPLRAWLEDWYITQDNDCAGCFEVTINAASTEFAVALTLRNTKPLVAHGDSGLSRKSATPGNASYYYSHSRLQTNGEVIVDQSRYPVHGSSWFDHEWSTSALEKDQAGWDWFSLQLSNQTELMLFRLRHVSDSALDFKYGSVIDRDGRITTLSAADFVLRPVTFWRSPETGRRYPSSWRITMPGHDANLTLDPRIDTQEMNLTFNYWEGAVRVTGTSAGAAIDGHGYMELTGYR